MQIPSFITQRAYELLAEYDAAAFLLNDIDSSYQYYGVNNAWSASPIYSGGGSDPDVYNDISAWFHHTFDSLTTDGACTSDELHVYALPITEGERWIGAYLRVTDDARVGHATRPEIGVLDMDNPNESDYPDGFMAHTGFGGIRSTHWQPPAQLIREHGQVPLAINEVVAVQSDLHPRTNEPADEHGFATIDELLHDQVFGEPGTSLSLHTLDDFADMLPGLDSGEYALGWDTDDIPTTGRLFSPDEPSPSFLLRYPETDGGQTLGPARRLLNAVAAQALARDVPVFAAGSCLSLCRGDDGQSRPHPLSDSMSWYESDRHQSAMVVTGDINLQIQLDSILDDDFLRDPRVVVFGLRPVEPGETIDEHDFYTHGLSCSSLNNLDNYVTVDSYDRETCFRAPPLSVQPPRPRHSLIDWDEPDEPLFG